MKGQCIFRIAFSGKSREAFIISLLVKVLVWMYFIPVIIFVVLYSKIIHTLRQRKNHTELSQSRTIDRATTDLTYSAIIVTVIYILSTTIGAVYLLMAAGGLALFDLGLPYQKVEVFLTTVNSSINPFVYLLFMPAFRRAAKTTITCQTCRSQN